MNFRRHSILLVIVALVAYGSWPAPADDDQPGDAATAQVSSPSDQESASGQKSRQEGSPEVPGGEEAPYVPKTKRELQRVLTRLQFDVTQNEATEPAFRNMYWNNKREGVYRCIVCGWDLFSSNTKYESGTGWPSFYAPIDVKHIGTRKDYRLFFTRVEVHCSRCNAHLGHVFNDGPQPTGLRFCMNSASLNFVEKSKSDDEDEESSK